MNHVIILAAGRSTRMGGDTPKMLLDIGGKPLIQSLVDNIKPGNLGPITLIINEQSGPAIQKMLGSEYQYVIQERQLGTGHAVAQAKSLLQSKADNVIVVNGDHPFTRGETLREMVELHEKKQAVLTLLTVYVPNYKGVNQILYDYGRIIRDQDGHIDSIRELKDCSPEEKAITEVNANFFCFQATWLWDYIEKITQANQQKEYYLTDMVAMAIKHKQKVATLSVSTVKEVIGVNTPQQLELARKIVTEREPIVSSNKE